MRCALPVGLLLLAAGCGSAHRVIISSDGRIGPLRMDGSTHADVIAFAGKPDSQQHAVEAGSMPYVGLGYGCSAKRGIDVFPLLETARAGRIGPSCRTIFWINKRTGRLGDFFTSSGRYQESHGVRVGMKTAEAERLLHRRAYVGCEENIYLGKRNASLTVAFDGGHPHKLRGSSGLHLIGGHVYAFTLHGLHSDVGIFDCL